MYDHDHEELLANYLEADQVAKEAERPVPSASLSRHATAALWTLRAFVVIIGAMVIYVFVSQLGS